MLCYIVCNVVLSFLVFCPLCRRERFRHRSADVARCWAKYGLMLLSYSRERLMSDGNENEAEASGASNSSTEELGNNEVTTCSSFMIFIPISIETCIFICLLA